ncbi:MAG: hypothetical protein HRT45_02515 [Bdellovibrionales bacterium]|nr:hypothetical protein [Bdellovibrionales bacterium]
MHTVAALFVSLTMAVALLPASSQAELLRLKYNELQIKDYDEMREMVEAQILKAKNISIQSEEEGDPESGDQPAIDALTKALKIIFSRPDKDNMVAKLAPGVKKELMNYNAYTDALNGIATDAIASLEMKKLPVVYRATSIFVLENLMSEIRPELVESQELFSIVKKIKKAEIEITKDVRNHRKLTGMYNTTSPSETASKIVGKVKKRRKKLQKKKDKQK